MPFTPEQLLAMSHKSGAARWPRAYQRERLAGSPPAPIFASADAQIEAEKKANKDPRLPHGREDPDGAGLAEALRNLLLPK